MRPSTDQIDSLFAEWNTSTTPGCVLAVIEEGEIAYSRAYGMADLERGVPLTTESVFDLGSTGKQFTAALLALLEREGVLSLSDSIQKYLPELPAYSRAITVRHLIHHTSGLRDYTTLMYLANQRFENFYFDGELYDLIARQQGINFAPGEEYLYCNTGYLLLGEIAKRTTGKPYTDLIRQYLLQPLGMNATTFNDDFRRIVPSRALGYSPSDDGGYWTDISFCGGYGDGALLSTVGDLFRWDQNFYDNRLGGERALIEQLTTPAALNSGKPIEYAFGLMIGQHHGLRMVRHGGAWAGYRAEMVRFPDQQLTVICLANLTSVNPSRLALQVADLFLADAARPQPITASPAANDQAALDVSRIVGVYRSQNSGSLAAFSQDEDALTLELMGYSFSMTAAGADRLKTTGSPVDVELVVQSNEAVAISLQGGEPTVYQRLAAGVPGQPSDIAGEYRSPELQISYRIALDGDQMMVKRGYAPPEALKFAANNLYASGFLIFEFFRDQAGQVRGFHLFADRVVNIRFDRSNA